MDPIAHTFTGAALAAAGLRRATPLATAALVIGANAPDVDVLTGFAGSYASLAMRRGWTHGVLAIVVLPFVVAALLLLWDRLRGRRVYRTPARAGPLLGLAALAVLTHPTLDWLNNYGMRWLMPLDGRWFYGDALFIVDPWVWLALGGVVFLATSRSAATLALWTAFWLLGTWLLFTVPFVPGPSRVLWVAGVVALFLARFVGPELGRPPVSERLAQVAIGCVVAYVAAAVVASAVARREVRSTLADLGVGPVTSVMVAPAAANPFAGSVMAATPDAYHLGEWRWFAEPRLRLDPEWIARHDADPVVVAASRTRSARDYLTWSRYPYFEIEYRDDGYVVRVRDARYHGLGALEGPNVRLDDNLKPLTAVTQ
jgi:inner membrane protein